MDPITLLAALGPLLGKLGNAAIDRWVRPDQFKPATVDEVEKLARIEIERFKALNEAGTSGPSYPWVNAIIQLQRPAVIAGLLAAALWQIAAQGEVSEFIANALGVVGSYLFMDRTLFHLSARK
jgi:hypothetical protein